MSFKENSKVGDGNKNVGNNMKGKDGTVNFNSARARLMTVLKSKDGSRLQVFKSNQINQLVNPIMGLDKINQN